MAEETLGERTKRIIKDARISPRILSSVTKVHYTTIYNLMRGDYTENTAYPNTVQTLSNALDKITQLIETGKLPFPNGTKHTEQAEKLEILLAEL